MKLTEQIAAELIEGKGAYDGPIRDMKHEVTYRINHDLHEINAAEGWAKKIDPSHLGGCLDHDRIEKHLKKIEAIIQSMAPKERGSPEIIDSRRKARIARGSGTSVQDVNRLIKQYVQARTMMKRIQKMGPRGLGRLFG